MKSKHNFTDLLATLEIAEYSVKLETYYLGGQNIGYRMYLKNKLLFEGNDFKPSPLYNIDDLQASVSLLSFLCVSEGGVDADYFKNYTKAQLVWSQSFECEQLSVLISDLEDEDSEYYEDAFYKVNFKIG